MNQTISPFKEMSAYEALWQHDKASFKSMAELFSQHKGFLPSMLVQNKEEIENTATKLKDYFQTRKYIKPQIIVNTSFDYPEKLRDAKYPIELFYFSGNLEYLSTRGIAIVGSRKPTENGLKRTEKLVKLLVKDNFTIFSGLAEGIDTMAHKTAINNDGRTVAVIGTPLSEFYPKQNKDLQLFIAKKHLLISQVPFVRYLNQDFRMNRFFFPERNVTMSALSDATVIVEASETSGTLIQARAALAQGRKLFILQNCFENPSITWAEKFEKQGAIRVREYSDIINNLQ